ncbi:insulinase family protein [Robertkochia sediminum]|uniref:insulinase family protein n=1 Tax=Robertkochia sediminum TaxID=2785326 RepID=UPI0019318775|nr:insulinase family protein [Robertkochia sediminum]MBL7471973.1 insulinase family protein [Robertkochia sediminum]
MKRLITLLLICSFTAVSAQIDRSVMPKSGPEPEINLGSPKEFTLPNGLTVLVVEDKKLPKVAFYLNIDNPPMAEGDKTGVASLTSSLLGQGSKNVPKDEFYEEVDFMGARINVYSGGAFASGLSKYTDRILELFSDAILNPDFKEEGLEDEKKKLKENIANNAKNVSNIAGRVSRALAYGKKHPRGEFATEESVDRVTLADVRSFYNNSFSPGSAYLIAVGDIEYRDIKKKITNHFSKWAKSSPLDLSYTQPEDAQYRQINFVDMPNAVQSDIRVQNLVNFTLNDEDYFPALLANYILGGGGEARLFQELREAKGYTYGAYSRATPSKYGPTTFQASASVRNEVTDSAVVAFLDVIDNFRNNPVSEEELKRAKAKYSGNFIMSLEDEETIADLALNVKINDLDKDFYKTYLENVNKVSVEDIQRVAQKYLKPEKFRIVVVGKGSEVLNGLENINYQGKKIPVKYFDSEATAIERPVYEVSAPEGMDGATVLNNYIEAIGGRSAIEAIKTIQATSTANIQGMPLEVEMKKGNGKFMLDMKMQGNSMSKQVYNGSEAFVVARGQKNVLEGEQAKKLAESAAIIPELDWLENAPELKGMEMVDGKPAYVLEIAEGELYYYDQETGLKVKQESTVKMGPNTMKNIQTFGDYRAVEGVMMPFSMSQNIGPQTIDLETQEVLVNQPMEESDFN